MTPTNGSVLPPRDGSPQGGRACYCPLTWDGHSHPMRRQASRLLHLLLTVQVQPAQQVQLQVQHELHARAAREAPSEWTWTPPGESPQQDEDAKNSKRASGVGAGAHAVMRKALEIGLRPGPEAEALSEAEAAPARRMCQCQWRVQWLAFGPCHENHRRWALAQLQTCAVLPVATNSQGKPVKTATGAVLDSVLQGALPLPRP